MNQRGFATLEVILMVMVIGILASIAVPRFTAVTTAANTAKVQSDLATLETAAAIYAMENGNSKTPLTITKDLEPYLKDASNIKPPKGDVYNTEGTNGILAVGNNDYAVAKDGNEYRATLEGKKADTFKKSSSGTTSGGTGGN